MTLRLPNSKLAVAPTLDGYQTTLSGVNPNIILRDSCVYMLTTPGSGAITIDNSLADNALIMLIGESYAGSATLSSGGNVLLSSTYTPSVGSCITLLWTGSVWQETARGATAVVTPVTSVGGTAPIASSGGTTPVISLNDDGVTFAKMQEITTDRLMGRDTPSTGNPEEISVGGGLEFTGSASIQRSALTGHVTATAGSGTTTIAADVVANTMLANMAQATIKGRAVAAGTGDPTDLTATESSALVHGVVALGINGSAGAPMYSFANADGYGMFLSSADTVSISTKSTTKFSVSPTAVTSTLQVLGATGTVTAPSFSKTGDTDTGFNLSAGTGQLELVADGVSVLSAVATRTIQPVFVQYTSQSITANTANTTITPTSTYVSLTTGSSSSGSIFISNGPANGTILYIRIVSAAGTAIIEDSVANSNCKLSANFTPTADDTLMLLWDGSDWVELSRSVN